MKSNTYLNSAADLIVSYGAPVVHSTSSMVTTYGPPILTATSELVSSYGKAALASTSNVISDYTKPLFSYFQGPQKVEEPFKKLARVRSTFVANKTPSLSLPELMTNRFDVVKPPRPPELPEPEAVEPAAFSMATLLNSLSVLWVSKPALNGETAPALAPASSSALSIMPSKPAVKKRQLKVGEKTVPEQMQALEAKLKKCTDLIEQDKLHYQKVELVSEEIIEHASRRTDLFFYLLIAMHNKRVIISKASTLLQHGQGSGARGTQACHSSLFPNIKIEKPASMLSLFSQKTYLSVFDNTQFQEILNMTMELPTIVNEFDSQLEGHFTQKSYLRSILATLNKVSNNELTPIEGLNEYFKTMDAFFVMMEKRHAKKENQVSAIKLVCALQKEGTFANVKKNTLLVDDNYLNLMLRLKPAAASKATKNPQLYLPYFKQIQDEIFQSKPEPVTTKKKRAKKPAVS